MRVSCQRRACNGSLAGCPVQVQWDGAQTCHFFHFFYLCIFFSSVSCSSSSSDPLPLPASLISDLPGARHRPPVSFFCRDGASHTCPQTHHARTLSLSLSTGDSGGAFSDRIPEDGPMWWMCAGSSCAVMSVLTERQQAAASQYAGPNGRSMMVHLYLCDSCSFISGLLLF